MNDDTMTMPAGLSVAERFFWTHAGYSWNSAKGETPEQGRERCARNLAAAEGIAQEAGYSFDWQQDDIDSSDWSDDPEPWPQYVCLMRDINGKVVQSLCGIDFGKDASGPFPFGDYRRVVEAELVAQECDEVLKGAAGVRS
jgi:hypothetical protein